MRISQLAERSGVPLATIKFYLREGLLMPGRPTSATQAEYGDDHVRRLALVRALVDVAGLPLRAVRVVIDAIEHPGTPVETLGRAIAALPPYGEDAAEHPRARWALETLGQVHDPEYPAVAQLERALGAAEAAGVGMDEDRLRAYGAAIMTIAEYDLSRAPAETARAVEYSVLGTALYEPVIAALRRLAHQDAAVRMLGDAGGGSQF